MAALAHGFLVYSKAPGGVKFTKDGVSVELNPRTESVSELVTRVVMAAEGGEETAIMARNQLEAVLAHHNYYHLKDVRWTANIRNIDITPELRASILQLLYDLAGPFSLPEALEGASDNFYRAVRALDERLRAQTPSDDDKARANDFFVELWRE